MASTQKSAREVEKSKLLAHRPESDEYEKMISSMLYDAFVPELEQGRLDARYWTYRYNNFYPPGVDTAEITKQRLAILRERMGHIGDEEIFVDPPFHVDYGFNISIGKRFYSSFNCSILDSALITIGDRVMIGPNVLITTSTHETEVESRRANIEFAQPITIGDDCWIGGGVKILSGVTIGDGCTIGAGAVVNKDIPSWSVAVGVPARVIKKVKEMPPV